MLRRRLQQAIGAGGVSLIVVSGPSKAGKSRTLAEALIASAPAAWLLAPRDQVALVAMARERVPSPVGSASPCVIWLDDIEPFVADPGLSPETLELLRSWRRPVLVVGTHGGKGTKLAEDGGFAERTSDLLRRHEPFRLRPELSAGEQARLAELSSREVAEQAHVLGEFMIAAPVLIDRYESVGECPEGVAVTRAAVDWRRAGIVRRAR